MGAYTELNIDQGTSWNDTLYLSNDITNANINVANYVVTGQLRKSYVAANASANITCTIADASNGVINLSMNASITANLKAGTYHFDVKTFDPASNNTSRILEGLIFISPGVTR